MSLHRRKVRKAQIPKSDRDTFERFGESVIGGILAGGFNPRAAELQSIYADVKMQEHARDWLTERGDSHERREQRLEAVEWAILLFVILGVILDVLLVLHHR